MSICTFLSINYLSCGNMGWVGRHLVSVEVEKNCLITIKNQVFDILTDTCANFSITFAMAKVMLRKTLIHTWAPVCGMNDLKPSWADMMGNGWDIFAPFSLLEMIKRIDNTLN